ncbi:hypothetical protein ABVT39_001470 [Epinephelus coioides]
MLTLLTPSMDSLRGDIFGKIDDLSTGLRSEISSIRQELQNSTEPLQRTVEAHDVTVRKRISVFPNYTSSVAKKRAAFSTVKCDLRSYPDVKFGLLYPAVLKVTMPDGTSHKFEDPTVATDFVNKNCK